MTTPKLADKVHGTYPKSSVPSRKIARTAGPLDW